MGERWKAKREILQRWSPGHLTPVTRLKIEERRVKRENSNAKA
jgi:hypothetical protein